MRVRFYIHFKPALKFSLDFLVIFTRFLKKSAILSPTISQSVGAPFSHHYVILVV